MDRFKEIVNCDCFGLIQGPAGFCTKTRASFPMPFPSTEYLEYLEKFHPSIANGTSPAEYSSELIRSEIIFDVVSIRKEKKYNIYKEPIHEGVNTYHSQLPIFYCPICGTRTKLDRPDSNSSEFWQRFINKINA